MKTINENALWDGCYTAAPRPLTPSEQRSEDGVSGRGAPAMALHVRDIVKQIFGFAILHGEKVSNPADEVGPSSIATFKPKDRSLSPIEIRVMLKMLEHVPILPRPCQRSVWGCDSSC